MSYHKKLQGFLARKDVKDTIKTPNAPRVTRHDAPVRRTRMLSKHSSLPDLHDVEGVMKEHKTENSNTHLLLQENLKKQEDSLESRFKARRMRSSTKSNKENILIKTKTDIYLDKIERIYEEEKIKRIKEVKSLYLGQIEEMKSVANCEILKQVVVEMEKSLEREIASVTVRILNEKNMELEKHKRRRGVTIA